MRKVDFDTAFANFDDDALRAMNRNELKLTYAIFAVMEEKLWRFANEHDTFDKNWRARNKKVTTCKERVIQIYKEVFPNEIYDTEIWCCVYPEDDMVTRREMEKGVGAKFDATTIEFISEDIYVFRVKTVSDNAQAIVDFMRSEWTDDLAAEEIEVEPIDIDCQYVPDLWSWNETTALVKKSKVKVTIAPPVIVPKSKKVVNELIEQARVALIQTGLSKNEATEHIITALGTDDCFLRVGILHK